MRRRWFGRRKKLRTEIHPDEILIDSSNLPEFDRDQFEGRIERPLGRRSLIAAGGAVSVLVAAMLFQAGNLQIVKGAAYAKQAEENQLAEGVIFADRGIIVDRMDRPLAWNDRASIEDDFAKRVYATMRGLAHPVGYAKSPAKDSSGFYFRDAFVGVDGAEKAFDARLAGKNGRKLTETDARGKVVSEAVARPAQAGERLVLSLDAKVNEGLFDAVSGRAKEAGAQGGAGVIMDVRTGELLAMTSYPEYSQQALNSGDADAIASYNADKSLPFLDRATDGLYSPGSIVKPVMAAGAIAEGVINEYKQILSTGQISIPNPYFPDQPTVFKDWRVNGWTDARHAIAVSSDVYFYAVGGGYKDQIGLGILNIDKYLRMFGLGSDAGLEGFSTKSGTIPTPEWKTLNFPDDPTWRLGNTYHTAIGQYGTLVTPLQAVRMAAAVAGGKLLEPSLLAGGSDSKGQELPIDPHALEVAREGMRLGVTEGIAGAIKFDFVHIAAKTGTAQVGTRNEYQNAWMIGFWPYENPKYAYAVVLERMPAGTQVGGSGVMYDFFTWMRDNEPGYLQ